jgi:hypothetical protein
MDSMRFHVVLSTTAKELPRAIIKRLDFIAEDMEGQLIGGIQVIIVNWGFHK